MASKLQEANDTLSAHGIRVGCHNHAHEFTAIEDGKTGWDIMMSEMSQEVNGQLDNGNALSGGGDALANLKKYPCRAYSFHLKPYSLADGFATMIGEDDINWTGTLDEIDAQGVTEWGIVEFSAKDRYPELEGAHRCLEALRKLGC